MDNTKYQAEGMKWLVELELLNHPQVINTIKFNVLMVSKHVREVELLIYRENKSMLVLVHLGWIGRKFFKRKIFIEIQEVLSQLLPSFRFRITDDPRIMELAVNRVKQALTGGKYENVPSASNDTSQLTSSTAAVSASDAPVQSGSVTEVSASDSEKQS